jgi:hypothetical protein
MKLILELSLEDFKANKGKTLEELLQGKGGAGKKPAKAKVEEDEEEDFGSEGEAEEDEAEEDSDEVSADMIKDAISAAVKAGNRAKVEALFKVFKAKTVSGLKEEKYDEFYTRLKPLTKKK